MRGYRGAAEDAWAGTRAGAGDVAAPYSASLERAPVRGSALGVVVAPDGSLGAAAGKERAGASSASWSWIP